jgi:hypothetical protein
MFKNLCTVSAALDVQEIRFYLVEQMQLWTFVRDEYNFCGRNRLFIRDPNIFCKYSEKLSDFTKKLTIVIWQLFI